MKHYIAYLPGGRITRYGNCSDDFSDWTILPGETGQEVTSPVMPNANYWDGSAVTAKTELAIDFDKTEIAADNVDVATLTGIPVGTLVTIDRDEYTVPDGQLELASPVAGEYLVVIALPEYFRKTWVITAS